MQIRGLSESNRNHNFYLYLLNTNNIFIVVIFNIRMAREDINILSEEEINEKLKYFPGWQYKDNKISKEFKFKEFLDVLAFLEKITPFFEKNDHHPDTENKFISSFIFCPEKS